MSAAELALFLIGLLCMGIGVYILLLRQDKATEPFPTVKSKPICACGDPQCPIPLPCSCRESDCDSGVGEHFAPRRHTVETVNDADPA